MPIEARAGFFSSIMGDEAHAEAGAPSISDTSSTLSILQAKVSPSSVIEDKNAAKAKKAEDTIDPDAQINIVSDNALFPTMGSLGVSSTGGGSEDLNIEDITVYVVRKGDTVSQVADLFGVSVDTVLSVNDLKKGDKLKEGDILLILPFSGVEYTVVKGDTLQSIAKRHKVALNDILLHNDIESGAKLTIGDKLIIPGAALPDAVKSSSSSIARSVPSQSSLPNLAGYFINPVPTARKSRGTSATHKGVDLAAMTGTPIYAAADGVVKFARNGYNGGFGNLVIITHSNGTETLYAHQSKISTTVGAQVVQGQIIGFVGNTGNSRGSHLHFEVHGARNPGNDWSWKY